MQVFMVRVSYNQKPYRRALMETYGARCIASPSNETAVRPRHSGQAPGPPGQPRHRHFRGGGSRRPARRHQIRARLGAEPRAAAPDRDRPGGDDAAGDGRRLSGRGGRLHRRRLQLRRHRRSRSSARNCAAAARSASSRSSRRPVPSLTRGQYAYDFGDTAHLTPLTKMHTLGSTFTPPGFHAGGLRYHGMAPLVSRTSRNWA
ncbi:MAG: hypothetical protein MZV49_12040 [Rhodopseudomonas palustris]|nr:hypothetical protein [Rhodopseudomonas palustris]